MPSAISEKAIGTKVKCKVNGAYLNFILVHKGNPDPELYDASCNGAWLLAERRYKNVSGDSMTYGGYNSELNEYTYSTGSVHSWLTNTYLSKIEASVRAMIKTVKIPYCDNSEDSVHSSANGLQCRIFAPSAYELGQSSNISVPHDGAKLDYFQGSYSSTKRVYCAYDSTSDTVRYWLRSPYNDDKSIVSADGDLSSIGGNQSCAVRPMFIIPLDTQVMDDNSLTDEKPPVITSPSGSNGTNLGSKESPFSFQYTVTSTVGPTTVTEKLNGVTLKTRNSVTSGSQFTFEVSTEDGFLKAILGSNTLSVTATDGTFTTTFTLTFTKDVYTSTVSHATGFETEELAAVAAMRLLGEIPEDAEVKIELTNNFDDSAPVWEDATAELQAGRNYPFENKTAANGNVFNFRVTLSRGPSDTGGYLSGIVGTFQGADD